VVSTLDEASLKRWLLAVLRLALLGTSLARSAGASDLGWSGPADCAQSEQLLFQVEQALGGPLADTGRVHLQVHVARTQPTARALLRIEDEAAEPAVSERSLVAPDCERLVDTLAVAITLALEAAAPPRDVRPSPPSAAPAAPLPTAAGALSPTQVSHPADVVDTEATSPEAARAVPRVVARVLGDVGSLPSPALGLALGAQLAWPRLQLELLGTLWSEQHARLTVSGLPEAGADLSLVTGSLSMCSTPLGADPAPLVLGLCLGWEMGRLSGQGTGISVPRQANGLWLAPEASVGLTWRPAQTLGLGARIGAAAPLGRNEFYLERLGTVHQPASVVARAGLSIDVGFE
jgi:hypothetical protein